MLTVIKPAKYSDLTTVDRAQKMLGFPDSEQWVVRVMIAQASRAIVGYCRRPFALETVREDFSAQAFHDGILLSRSPVVSGLVVEIGGRPASDDEQYRYDSATGRLFRVTDDGREIMIFGPASITYSAGYVLPGDATLETPTTLPANVERAAIQIVGAYRSLRGRDPTVKSETIEGVGATSWWVPSANSPLPDPEAVHLLAEFRRFF